MTNMLYPMFLRGISPHVLYCHTPVWWYNESARVISPSIQDIITLVIKPHVNLMTGERSAPIATAGLKHPPKTTVNHKGLSDIKSVTI